MAGSAQLATVQSSLTENPASTREFTALQSACLDLFARGAAVRTVAKAYLDHLVPPDGKKDRRSRVTAACKKLRDWSRSQSWRDELWERAVAVLDKDAPLILEGIGKKAKSGRVDAARLALEVTGRHNPKGDAAPTQIVVAFGNMPRPGQIVEGQAVEVE